VGVGVCVGMSGCVRACVWGCGWVGVGGCVGVCGWLGNTVVNNLIMGA
jgi:hypothetical protein